MHASTRMFSDFLKQKGRKFSVTEAAELEKSTKDILKITFSGDNTDVAMKFFFSEDCEDVAIRVFDLVKVPSGKIASVIVAINKLNGKYRFAKFCLDMKDNTVQPRFSA